MTTVFRGFVGEFLSRLRAYESGIDPDRYEWHLQCYDKPVIRGTADYWQDRILELREQIALMDEGPLWPV